MLLHRAECVDGRVCEDSNEVEVLLVLLDLERYVTIHPMKPIQ